MNRQYISTTSTLNIEAEREQLRQLEAVRDDIRRRGVQWNAGLWERSLRRLAACEAARDAKYQQRIDELHADNQEQRYVEMALESAIAADIAWYEQLAGRQDALAERWQAEAQAHRSELAELLDHRAQIQARILALRVRRAQVGLESLERQRGASGRLADGAWARGWAALQGAFRRQDQFYQSLAAEKPSAGLSGAELAVLQQRRQSAQDALAAITAQRLAWCRRLRATQQRAGAALDRMDRAALVADARQLDAALGELRPGAGSQLIWIVVLCAVLLIGLAYFLTLVRL